MNDEQLWRRTTRQLQFCACVYAIAMGTLAVMASISAQPGFAAAIAGFCSGIGSMVTLDCALMLRDYTHGHGPDRHCHRHMRRAGGDGAVLSPQEYEAAWGRWLRAMQPQPTPAMRSQVSLIRGGMAGACAIARSLEQRWGILNQSRVEDAICVPAIGTEWDRRR